MYIQNVANKKRKTEYAIKKLGCYRLTSKDIMVLQKILRRYADVCESKKDIINGRTRRLPEGRGVMPRGLMDMHVAIGALTADHVGLLPKRIKKTRHLEVNCTPGIKIEFRPLSTRIGSQENYATGVELLTMHKVLDEIRRYLAGRRKSLFNIIRIN